MAERFASVSKEELKVLIENKDSKNTKRTTKTNAKILNDYLSEKNLEEPQIHVSAHFGLKPKWSQIKVFVCKLFENV